MKRILLCAAVLAAGTSFGQFSEDFEGTSGTALPAGWTQVTAATDGGYKTGTDLSSTYWTIPTHTRYVGTNDDACDCDKSNERLISPAFTGPAGGVLEFDYTIPGGYSETATVGISTDGGATSTTIGTLTASAGGSAPTTWDSFSGDISAYAGQTINIVWTYDDAGNWAYGLVIDDVNAFAPAAVDMEATAYTVASTVAAGMVNITGTVKSNGTANITSIDISWNDGSGANNATFPVNLNFGDTYNFTHPTQLNAVAGTTYNIDVCVTAAGDADNTNDCISGSTSVVSALVPKVVVGEEKTGEWCGWCPRGAVALANMSLSNPNDFIGIAVHNGDGMVVSSYDSNIGTYVPGGYPGGGVDRVIDGDPSAFASMHAARAGMVPPASISVTGSYNGTNVTVTVTGDFVGSLSGDYRLAAVLVEDGVSGAGQANYYSGGGSGPLAYPNTGSMPNYDWAAGPSTVNPVWHDHVARALGSNQINGAAGSLPGTITAGASLSHTYTIPQSGSWNMGNMHIVGMLVNGSTGEILNAGKGDFLGLDETTNTEFNVNVAPNPTSGVADIIVDLTDASTMDIVVVDMLGNVVYTLGSTDLPAGSFAATVDLSNEASGVYFAKVSVNGTIETVKINVAK